MSTVPARAPAAKLVRPPLAAICFLTRLPLAGRVALDGEDVARAGPSFPVVGAGTGAIVGLIASSLAGALTPLLAVALALGAAILLTGALHLDALADAADALGAHSEEQALEIMRDPRVGSFGATAITLDVLLKAAALTALLRDHHVVALAATAGALSRLTPVLLAAWLPYARATGGTGVALTRGGRLRAAIAGVIALAIVIPIAGVAGLELAGLTVALTGLGGISSQRRLAGVTGDTLGAALELSETVALVIAVALVGHK